MRWAARMKPWTSEAMPAGVALGLADGAGRGDRDEQATEGGGELQGRLDVRERGIAMVMSRTTINRQEAMTASAIPTPLVFCGVVVSEVVMAGSPVNGTVH